MDFIEISKYHEGRFGKRPEDRSIAELLEYGLVVVDKPPGPTSRDVTEYVKKLFGVSKAGHAGTLDPNATGVLPIALGRASKIISLFQGLRKKYVAVIHLHRDFARDELEAALKKFVGVIKQRPPLRSAVARKPRVREIYSIDILDTDGRNICVSISCQAGTYIRKIAHDLGITLVSGGHLKELRRTDAGNFNEKDAISLHNLQTIWNEYKNDGNDERLRRIIIPVENALPNPKSVIVKDSTIPSILNGSPIFTAGICRVQKNIAKGDKVGIFSLKGEIIATGISLISSEEMANRRAMAVRVERVLR